jgi:hypothetical protein
MRFKMAAVKWPSVQYILDEDLQRKKALWNCLVVLGRKIVHITRALLERQY